MSQTFGTFAADPVSLDPAIYPERFDGVRSRRIAAFLVDAAILLILMTLAFVVVGLLGVFTLGLGWLLFPLIWPVVPILYSVFTLSGPHSATPGMRLIGIEIRTVEGEPMTPLLALLHALGFWFSVTLLTPLILLVALLNARKQLLHDLLLGTVAVRSR